MLTETDGSGRELTASAPKIILLNPQSDKLVSTLRARATAELERATFELMRRNAERFRTITTETVPSSTTTAH